MVKLGKIVKWSFIISGGLLVLLLTAAIAIPYFFKNDLLNKGKQFANEHINAELDFDENTVSLSLFSDFPNLSFSIEKLSVTGKEAFEGKKLAEIGKFYFTVNVLDLIRGEYRVNGIILDDPNFYVKVLRNGQANYDIVESNEDTSSSSSSSDLQLSIDHWEVNNMNVIYDDEPQHLYVEIRDFDHSGSGDFSQSLVDCQTQTTIKELTAKLGRISYLKKAKIGIDFNATLDLANQVYTLKDNSFRINALELNADGSIRLPNATDTKLDLTFKAPKISFASVLSLIPAAYMADFDQVKTKGKVQLEAFVKGIYNTKRLPAFAVNLVVDEAEAKYPDVPLPLKNIAAKIAIKSPSSNLDAMTIQVPRFHIEIGKNPFDATLNLAHPISDPDIQTTVDGTINLGQLQQALPLEGVSKLTGIINANLEMDTRLSYVDQKAYDKIKTLGKLTMKGVQYHADGLPPVKVHALDMDFSPKAVNISDFNLNVGRSDLRGQGALDNIMAYFSKKNRMKGKLVVHSNYFDANEFLTEEQGEENEATTADNATNMQDTTTASVPVFDNFEFDLDAKMKAIRYGEHNIVNVALDGNVSPSKANLKNFELMIGKIDVKAKGELQNIFGYLFDDETIVGNLAVYSNYMNLNQFMTEDGTAVEPEALPSTTDQAESELEPIQVPANIDFTLSSSFKRFLYDNYDFKNVQAKVHIHEQIVEIVALQAKAFGGQVAMNGSYNTQDPAVPKFVFGYNVKQLDIQKIAHQVGVSERFVPLLKSIYGNLNSEFEIKGNLMENMYPDMASIVSKGIFKTFNTEIKNNKTVQQLGRKLNIKGLEKLNLGNTTNFFTIENGRLKIDPAAYQVKGMNIIFGGEHGLDNSIDYDMKLRIPRALLAQTPIGSAVNSQIDKGLSVLLPQAQKLGVNLKESKFVNVHVDILGSVTKPNFKVKLLGAEGAGNVGQQITTTIKDEAQKVKEEVEAKAKAEAERLKKEAEAKLEAEKKRLQKEAEERAKKLAQQAIKDPNAALDSLKNTNIKDILNGDGNLLDGKKQLEDILKGNKKGEEGKDANPFGKFKNPFGKK